MFKFHQTAAYGEMFDGQVCCFVPGLFKFQQFLVCLDAQALTTTIGRFNDETIRTIIDQLRSLKFRPLQSKT